MRSIAMAAGVVGAVLALSVPASAAPITWVDWTGNMPGQTTGFASGKAGTLTVSYSGEVEGLLYGYPSYAPASTWVGGLVGNVPDPKDIIRLYGGSASKTDTITFSAPVRNPVLAIWSLGAPGTAAKFFFQGTPTFDAGGPSAEYGGNPLTVVGNEVTGQEGNGSIHFTGLVSSIQFTTPVYENWYGFTVGVPAPEPAGLAVLGMGLLGLVAARRLRKA